LPGPIGDSMQIHDDQFRKILDPFQIKNLAHPSNRPPNIAHRRAKHGIGPAFRACYISVDLGLEH
jgi:hypothetical protein